MKKFNFNTYNLNNKQKLILSIIIFSFSIFLFLAFNSYWNNWKIDQVRGEHTDIQNILGPVGAFFSKKLITSFGISAYIINIILFTISLKLINKIKSKYLDFLTNISLFMFWLMLLSSFLFPGKLSGNLGDNIINFLINNIAKTGVWIVIISYLIILIIIFSKNYPKINFNIIKKIFNIKQIIKKKSKESKNNITSKNEISIDITTQKKEINKEKIIDKNLKKQKDLDFINVKTANEEKSVKENNQENVLQQYGEYNPRMELENYIFPKLDLLKKYDNSISINKEELNENKQNIIDTLRNFGIEITQMSAEVGPTITLYEIVPKEGIKISKIKSLEDDIALRIKASGVRIIAPLPGKGTIGIEVPNQNPSMVSMRSVLSSEIFQKSELELPLAIGKTISNNTFITDLTKMPHLLMAGATGQGKSVGLNAVICSILFKKHPSEVKFVLVDPKKVELTLYNKLKRHFLAKLPNNSEPITTDTKQVIKTLKSLCLEMDNRYNLLKAAQTRNIIEYNEKFKLRKLNPQKGHKFLPYIILIIDEFADLIMTAGREIETPIARLAQLARAIGIHLIIATQRPTTNIITGTIKANFPTRIAFRVSQGIDSKTILDSMGANQLIGRGDMLISTGNELIRLQCAFIDTPEVEKLTSFIEEQKNYPKPYELPEIIDENSDKESKIKSNERDVLFVEAAKLVLRQQKGSIGMIQRKMSIGFNRAGRIMDELEDAGIVSAGSGSKPREVLINSEEELFIILKSKDE